jgi:nicotinamide mononucleotide (NMN) deamidase PncC
VGTVVVGMAWGKGGEAEAVARTFAFPGDREWVRDRSAKMALTLLRYYLRGERAPF